MELNQYEEMMKKSLANLEEEDRKSTRLNSSHNA